MNDNNKGIIVVDIPKNCKDCRFYYFARDQHTGNLFGGCRIIPTVAIRDMSIIQEWCPIKPIPDKFNTDKIEDCWEFADGWNTCINEITRGIK